MWQKMIEYLLQNGNALLIQTRDHLVISLIAVGIAGLAGVPLGYAASKTELAEKVISTPFQILRVVPSLAVLIVLIPIIGIGKLPAIIALTILAIPPVLVNTVVGFWSIPSFTLECAAGIGLDKGDILWKVRVPMAMPMIMAGIRTGLTEAIASATLAAKIGAGGLGEIIFTGLGLYRMDLLILGGFLVAMLSLLSGFVFDLMTKHFVYNA